MRLLPPYVADHSPGSSRVFGGRTSRVYCLPGEPLRDSQRLRSRLGRYLSELKDVGQIIKRIEIETGTRVPYKGVQLSLDLFFQKAELRDVLDAVTLIYQTLTGEAEAMQAMFPKEAGPYWKRARDWRDFVARVLAEEHTTYGIDDHCNVRYAVDEAYALARRATLNGLQGGDWAAVRPEFERAFEALDGEPDPNAAVRAIAAAVESCLKTVIGNGVPRVGPAEIERYLWPKISDLHANDRAAADASHQILKSLGFWIVGSHQYRHGQDGAAEVRAPIELAVQFLSLGAAHIRWLIELQFKLKAAN